MKQITTNQIVEEKTKDRRPGKGRAIALSRRIIRLRNTDIYYVESESSDNVYYFVKFKPDVFEICSCPDSWTRHVKCKHLWGIEFAIMKGTLKDIDKLPAEAKRYGTTTIVSKSCRDEEYDF